MCHLENFANDLSLHSAGWQEHSLVLLNLLIQMCLGTLQFQFVENLTYRHYSSLRYKIIEHFPKGRKLLWIVVPQDSKATCVEHVDQDELSFLMNACSSAGTCRALTFT